MVNSYRTNNIVNILRTLFALILLTMLTVTTWASLQQNILKIPAPVTGNPWFIATMFDAYFGFTTFYVWVFYKEKSAPARVLWFLAIMALGNMGMASYMLLKLRRASDMKSLLLRAPD
ncbi:MAG: DUF1475 family protein [Cyanobacteria bacterium SZAS TMP-1]|nr:DUF1475 family protein [Cyanobacteria bacterium SZAS TMP-1]